MITRRQVRLGSSDNLVTKENMMSNDDAIARAKRTAFGEINGNRLNQAAPVANVNENEKLKRSAFAEIVPSNKMSIVTTKGDNTNDEQCLDEKQVAVPSATSWIDRLPAMDRGDISDPRFVAEYVSVIFENMRSLETKYQAPSDYLARCQCDINERMRGVLVDWLVEVHYKFKLYPETLFLCVSLMDRYLSKRHNISRSSLQLVGVTCLLIASKYEDIYAPEIKDVVHICDKTYRKEEILQMEVNILNTLQFEITAPSPLLFMLRLGKAMRCDEKHFYLAQYCLELALPDYKLWLRYSPSLIAAGAVYLSNKLLRLAPAWPAHVAAAVDHSEVVVKACAKEICLLLQNTEDSQLKAVRKKFSQPKFHSVAKLVL